MGESIKSYIDDLFNYIQVYENNYSQFQTEAFFQTYNGIYAVFQALRQQREKAIEVDQYFLERTKAGPITSSDLRQLTLQVLISFFESVADTDGQSNRAYLYIRDLRSTKRDVTYFEGSLVPILYREGSLNANFELSEFFLKEIGRFIQKFGSGVRGDLTPEQFSTMPDHLKLLELSRRRFELGKELLKDRNSLEFHLHEIDSFEKLSHASPVFKHYLTKWNYLIKSSFWDKVTNSLGVIGSKLKGLFSSFGYFKLSLAQRNSAYFFYAVVIILFIWLAVYVPIYWNNHTQDKLIEFENRVDETQQAISK